MDENLTILIMAGGKGTRFWPKSTEDTPKQFLSLVGENTMLQMTYERALKIVPSERIFIVTGEKYKGLVKEQLVDIDDKNIVIEPIGRNTAPCILLASLYIKQIYNDCNIAVLPADHLIKNEAVFCDVLKNANSFVNDNNESIVTIGITPDRPETGYGYIKFNKDETGTVVKVDRFVEKPNLDKAKEYLDSKEYLWNAGMFIFNVNYMLKELEVNYAETYNLLNRLPSIYDENYMEVLNEVYPNSESISIDYAVMEKSEKIYVIPTDFGWDDIGTWKSLERYLDKDVADNISKGKEIELSDSKNCIVYGDNKKILLIDVEDVCVIEGEDTIVVCKKGSIDKIKNFRK